MTEEELKQHIYEFSVTRARQKALLHISNSIECMMDLMEDLRVESEERK